MPEPYLSKEVWDIHLAYLNAKIDDLHKKLDAILEQTTKTNGRVTAHDRSILRIWTIGTTAWAGLLAYLAYLATQ